MKEGVLLLDAEHRLEPRVLLGDGECGRAIVGDVGGQVGVQHFTHDEDVVGSAKRVGARVDGVQHAVRREAGGLSGA